MAKNHKRLFDSLETESATASTTLSNVEVKQRYKKSKSEAVKKEIKELVHNSNLDHPTLALYNPGSRLLNNFFDVPCEVLAQGLLGQVLVRMLPDKSKMRCKIVETECYLGGDDKASHTYNGRVTERNKPMYMKPGTTYVYFTYGMYHCFNISSQGDGAAVLLRAAEPIDGLETMHLHRKAHQKIEKQKMLKPHELCNGPSKLCMSLAIERFSCNKQDLSQWSEMWIEKGTESKDRPQVVSSSRIGIDRVGAEWAQKPLRFYLLGNSSVSKRDKISENRLASQPQHLY